jgi:hypothetical protein
MAQDNFHGTAEKAEQVGASIQGAVLEQPANLDVPPAHGTPQVHSGEAQDTQDGARDLEELAAVSTGPVYSAFSTWQKRYIVLMVGLNFLPL